jgi:hypothetical protein
VSDPGANFSTALDAIMYTLPAASTATVCSPVLKVSPEWSGTDGNLVHAFDPGANRTRQLLLLRPRLQLT